MTDTGFYVPELSARVSRGEALKIIWRHTHRDYKGRMRAGTGERSLLIHRVNVGSCLIPLADLTDEEIADRLKGCIKAEIRRRVLPKGKA